MITITVKLKNVPQPIGWQALWSVSFGYFYWMVRYDSNITGQTAGGLQQKLGTAADLEGASFTFTLDSSLLLEFGKGQLGGILHYIGWDQYAWSQLFLPEDGKTYIWDLSGFVDGLVTIPGGVPPALTGEILDALYWYSGISDWGSLSGASVPQNTPVYFSVPWVNKSSASMVGCVALTLLLPNGEEVLVPSYAGQNSEAMPGDEKSVQLGPVSLSSSGGWTAKAVLSGWDPATVIKRDLAERKFSFTVQAAPPSPPPTDNLTTAMTAMLTLVVMSTIMGAIEAT